MPRLSSPLNAKASVRSPYALDRSQQNSCVGTVWFQLYERAGTRPHMRFVLMSSRVGPQSLRGDRANPSIHNVIRRPGRNLTGNLVSLRSLSRFWWSQTGSNRRPHACKARALPTELWPLFEAAPAWELVVDLSARGSHEVWWAQADSNCRPHAYQACALTN